MPAVLQFAGFNNIVSEHLAQDNKHPMLFCQKLTDDITLMSNLSMFLIIVFNNTNQISHQNTTMKAKNVPEITNFKNYQITC